MAHKLQGKQHKGKSAKPKMSEKRRRSVVKGFMESTGMNNKYKHGKCCD